MKGEKHLWEVDCKKKEENQREANSAVEGLSQDRGALRKGI